MKPSLFLIVFILFYCSCSRQGKKIALTITNRSHTLIDSVSFPSMGIPAVRDIAIGEVANIEVDVSGVKAWHKGLLSLNIYQGQWKYQAGWGLHDYGIFA